MGQLIMGLSLISPLLNILDLFFCPQGHNGDEPN